MNNGPRYKVKGYLGQSGLIDRFLCDFQDEGETFDAHMLWAPNDGVGEALKDAAMFFGQYPRPQCADLLAAASVRNGVAIWVETSQVLPLSEIGGNGSLPEPAVVWVADQVLRFLAGLRTIYGDAQTQARRVHRNLNPENLWLTFDGRLQIGGIESLAGEWPERSVAAAATEHLQTDVYSLALVVYELLGGPSALEDMNGRIARSRGAVHHNHAVEASLHRVRGPERLKAILRECLEFDVNRRPDPTTLVRRLSSLVPSGEALAKVAAQTPETAWSWSDSNHLFVGIGNMATPRSQRMAGGAVTPVDRAVLAPPPSAVGESTDFIQVVKPRVRGAGAPDVGELGVDLQTAEVGTEVPAHLAEEPHITAAEVKAEVQAVVAGVMPVVDPKAPLSPRAKGLIAGGVLAVLLVAMVGFFLVVLVLAMALAF